MLRQISSVQEWSNSEDCDPFLVLVLGLCSLEVREPEFSLVMLVERASRCLRPADWSAQDWLSCS